MRRANLHAGPRFCAHVLESSILQIAEHSVRLPVVLLRIDVGIFTDVGIGAEQVLVAVVIEVVNARTPATHLDALKTNACCISISAEEAVTLVTEQREGLTPKSSHKQARVTVVVPVAKVDARAASPHSIFRVRHEGLDTDLVESVARTILEQEIPFVVVSDENVHPSIAVVVSNCHAHAFSDVLRNSRHIGDVGEGTIAIVVVQDVWLSLVKRRRTGDALAGRTANPGSRKRPVQIVA